MHAAQYRPGWACENIGWLRLLTIVFCCLGLGCISEKERRFDEAASPHGVRYHEGFQNLRLPPVEDVQKISASKSFNQPQDEVWKACLEVASQYQGILAIEKSAHGRSLCAVKGRDAQMGPSDRMTEATFGSCYDQWLVMAVYDDSGMTGVSVAILDPISGTLRKSAASEENLFAQIVIQLNSANTWADKFANVDWEKRQTRPDAGSKGPARPVTSKDFEVTLGNWIGKRLRLELGMVNCPEVTQSLDIVAQRLKDAAGISTMSSGVHVLGSPSINAFALPNGEIYVTSGLLDSAQSIDEVASVLAHEISHLKNRDVAEKLRTQAQGDAGANALRFAWALSQLALACVPVGGQVASAGADMVRNAASTAVGTAVDRGAQGMQVGMVEGFSENIELRADEEGCKILYRAGFNPDANLSLLADLNEKKTNNKLPPKTLAMSNFVNMKPDLDKRMARMKKTVDALKAGDVSTH